MKNQIIMGANNLKIINRVKGLRIFNLLKANHCQTKINKNKKHLLSKSLSINRNKQS